MEQVSSARLCNSDFAEARLNFLPSTQVFSGMVVHYDGRLPLDVRLRSMCGAHHGLRAGRASYCAGQRSRASSVSFLRESTQGMAVSSTVEIEKP